MLCMPACSFMGSCKSGRIGISHSQHTGCPSTSRTYARSRDTLLRNSENQSQQKIGLLGAGSPCKSDCHAWECGGGGAATSSYTMHFQMLHIIDSVLEPLVPISLRDAEYFVKLDAKKLLTKSTLYELDRHRTRAFYQQVDENRSGSDWRSSADDGGSRK